MAVAAAVGCLLSGPGGVLAAQMAASLDREKVYLGTPAVLAVDVVDASTNEWPVVGAVDGLQITPYGSPRIVRDLFSGSVQRSYRFVVNPLRAGTFTIPAVTFGSGADALTQGPFTLRAVEAAISFQSAKIEPEEIRPGERATLTIMYRGNGTGKSLTIPAVNGVALRPVGPAQVEATRPEGMPVSTYRVEATAAQLGSYEIKGISLEGVAADAVKLRVSSFVVASVQVNPTSLAVGGQAMVHLVVRGLPQSAGLELVAPAGLKIQPAQVPSRAPAGTSVFSFAVTATEPGAPTITTLELADGRQVPLVNPITLLVRSGGKADILAGRGTARSQETILGEPFIVDYEVLFRGDLQGAGIDASGADFANRPYIKVEPVSDLSYPGWSGQPVEIAWNANGRAKALLGSGELNGQKEQSIRFALKVTPLAAGELDLAGVRMVLRLLTREERRTGTGFFSNTTSQNYIRAIDVAPHKVMDPPGKTQPPGYRGAVGTSFTYAAALDRTSATAMSPLNLTLKIAGEGVGPQFKPPALTEIPELVRDFDVSPTTGGGDVQAETITFTQVVRPRSEAVKELPALPLVYYNYEKKDYETVYSLPIPITVTPGSLVGATAMQTRTGAESPPAQARGGVAGAAEGVSLGANHGTLGEVVSGAPLGAGGVVAVLLAGPIAIVGVWVGRRWYERHRPMASIRRQRRELVDALGRLDGKGDFHVQLAGLVQSYLRLTCALPPGEVSAGALAEIKGLDGGLRQAIAELLVRCDSGRFAAAGVDGAERERLQAQARELFAKLDQVRVLDSGIRISG